MKTRVRRKSNRRREGGDLIKRTHICQAERMKREAKRTLPRKEKKPIFFFLSQGSQVWFVVGEREGFDSFSVGAYVLFLCFVFFFVFISLECFFSLQNQAEPVKLIIPNQILCKNWLVYCLKLKHNLNQFTVMILIKL